MNISELFDLHGRTVLITGGSGALGRVMASGLAQAGARVAVLGRREEPALAADVLDRTALERASETITATLGPVDILINGAGGNQPQATTGPDRTFFDLEIAAIRHVFDANVTGAIACSQVFGRVKAERRQGCIINVASMAGLRPLTRVVTYGTAKAALGKLTSRGQAIINHTPAGRLGEPVDLLGTLLWLVSPASAFVTGVVIHPGGWGLRLL